MTRGPATASWADRVALTARDLGGEQLLGVLGHHPAGIGEDQVATRPLDQGDAEGRLERGEVLGGRSRRVAEVLGGRGQGASP